MLWREPMWGPMCLVFSLRPTWQSNWLATAAGRTAKWLEVRSGPRKSCVLLVSWTRVYKSWCCNHELTTLVVHDIVSTIKSDVNMVARRRLLLASVIISRFFVINVQIALIRVLREVSKTRLVMLPFPSVFPTICTSAPPTIRLLSRVVGKPNNIGYKRTGASIPHINDGANAPWKK